LLFVAAAGQNWKARVLGETGIRKRKLALQERRGAVGRDQPGVNTVAAEAKIVCGDE
jgi:hypothetical protein